MPTQSERIVEALNCVAKFHSYNFIEGRIIERELAFCGDSHDISQDEAIETLESCVEAQRIMLKQAEHTLRQIRRSALEPAQLALDSCPGE